ncbi:MFS transporter, partial [Staphylococcus epidermidis]|uniref:MFS transporter n=1 Tax=Staphylococcus epidermidis TaxID=1282 RepID=UPI0011A599A8
SQNYPTIKTILLAITPLLIISLIIPIVHSFTLLLILTALQPLFPPSFSPVLITYTTQTYPPLKRLTPISFITTSFILSALLAQNITQLLLTYFNSHSLYFILTILYLILLLLIY